MKTAAVVSAVLMTVLPLFAGSTQTVNAPCDKAITKAMVFAAHRKWASLRPDPQAPVLNIETHANFGKDILLPLGAVWSHPKGGELVFDEQQDNTCEVTSNGHPADVVLSDLVKALPQRTANAADTGKKVPPAKGNKAAPSSAADSNGGFRQINQ